MLTMQRPDVTPHPPHLHHPNLVQIRNTRPKHPDRIAPSTGPHTPSPGPHLPLTHLPAVCLPPPPWLTCIITPLMPLRNPLGGRGEPGEPNVSAQVRGSRWATCHRGDSHSCPPGHGVTMAAAAFRLRAVLISRNGEPSHTHLPHDYIHTHLPHDYTHTSPLMTTYTHISPHDYTHTHLPP